MGRIGASLSGSELRLLNRLSKAQTAATLNNLRLATGKRINFPKDDPSGFVSLSGFESELSAVQQATANVTAATSMVSQTQMTLDQVRTELDTIRTKLLEDESGTLTADERTANQAAIDSALDTINELAATEIDGKRLLDGSADFQTTGREPSQITSLQVLAAGGPTLESEGKQAEVVHEGAGGVFAGTSNVTFEGNLGAVTLDVSPTLSLAEAAHTINSSTSQTGLEAEAVGDSLFVRSTGTRSSDSVRVTTNSGDPFTATGADANGKAVGADPVLATSASIAGRVEQAATRAFLSHDAGGATISADANFTITGRLGEATIDVQASENLALADFAQRINNESHKTGVLATVNGDEIELRSARTGSRSKVEITVNSGSFATVDADGNAATSSAGTDAVAVINGRKLSGATPATAAKLTHHTPAGVLTANAQLQITGPSGSAAISIDVSADDTLAGLKTQIDGAGIGLTATIDGNDLVITSDTTGSDANLEIRVLSGTFAVDGGNGDGTAQGTDAAPQSVSVDGNRFTVLDGGLQAVVEFAENFTGELSTVGVTGGALSFSLSAEPSRPSTLALPGVQTHRFTGASGSLEDIRAGGSAAGLADNTSRAIRIVDEALSRLSLIEGRVDGFADATIASAASLSAGREEELNDAITSLDGIDQDAENLLLAKNEALASNAIASLAVLDQQRSRIVELIQSIAGL